MNENSSPELAAASALVNLLTAKPELHAMVWTVGETPGVLNGRHYGDSGTGELVDAIAAIAGGTVVRSVLSRDGERDGVAQLVTTYAGASICVWASYPLPNANGLTYTRLCEILDARPLGTLVCLPGGAQ